MARKRATKKSGKRAPARKRSSLKIDPKGSYKVTWLSGAASVVSGAYVAAKLAFLKLKAGRIVNLRNGRVLFNAGAGKALLALAVLWLFSLPAFAQFRNLRFVNGITPGSTVGAKVANAVATCLASTSVDCYLILTPELALFPSGTFPALASHIVIVDLRGQAGTGPVVSPSGAVFNVRTFGAEGDGTADDTAAINAAIKAAEATGDAAVVSFPMGDYCLTDTLDVDTAHLVGKSVRNTSALLWCTTTSSFSITGTPTLTNASKAVTGSGTLFTTELEVGDLVKRDVDGNDDWAMVGSITNDTTLTLAEDYTGATGATASSRGAVMIRKNSSASFWRLEHLALLRNSTSEQPITFVSLGTTTDIFLRIQDVHMSGALQHCMRVNKWVNFHLNKMRWDACGGFAVDSLMGGGMSARSWSLDDFTYAFDDSSVTATGGFRFKKVGGNDAGVIRISNARVEIGGTGTWDAGGVQALVQIEWEVGESGARWGQVHLEDIAYQDVIGMTGDVLLGLVNEPGGNSPFPYMLSNLKVSGLSDTLGPDAASWNGLSIPVPTEGRYGVVVGDVALNFFQSEVEFGTGGIAVDGLGFKHGRTTTGAITTGASAAITVTWATAFADANYTAFCSVIEADTDVATIQIDHIESKSASAIVVRVENEDGAATRTGELQCVAVHD